MISLLVRFVLLIIVAAMFAWLADQPGDLTLRWLGYEIETSLMAALIIVTALVLVLWIIWSIVMWVLDRPGAFGGWFKSRRQRKGRHALSSGLIAVAAGDSDAAQAHARTASSILGDDPMVKLLDAQAAQMRGDNARVRELFEDMAEQPETRLLGLRGLHTDAVRQSDTVRARALAEEAVRINPKASWAGKAVLSYQSSNEDWAAISRTIDTQRAASLIDKPTANLKLAVVLTAQALEAEDNNDADAWDLALRAHKLDPSLVPAAIIAARHATAAGSLRKASRIIEKTWNLTPHPDLADAYGHVRSGDSALDRLKRVKSLVSKSGGIEGAVALATAAIDALEWKTAREALSAYAHDRPQARICGLMAEIEEGEFGDKGRAREWLARAVRAPRDPAWTADGYISATWLPVSPVSGELGGFKWKVPVEGIAYEDPDLAAADADTDAVPGDDAIDITTPEPDAGAEPEAGSGSDATAEAETPQETVEAEAEETDQPDSSEPETVEADVAEPDKTDTASTEPQADEPAKDVKASADGDSDTDAPEKEPEPDADAEVETGTRQGKPDPQPENQPEPEPDDAAEPEKKPANARKAAPVATAKDPAPEAEADDIEPAGLTRQPDDPGPTNGAGRKTDKGWF